MDAGFRAAWVIPWRDVTIDGLRAPPMTSLGPGAAVSWTGEPQAIVNPGAPLRLCRAQPAGPGRTARQRLMSSERLAAAGSEPHDSGLPQHLILTDGTTSVLCRLVEGLHGWICIFDHPPTGRAFWIAGLSLQPSRTGSPPGPAGLLAGTQVLTVRGRRDVARLEPGDLIVTRDGGPLPLTGLHVRTLGSARLYAEPALRPVRLPAPDGWMCAAPGQPVLVGGQACADCFLTPDVLIRATDLVDDRHARCDLQTRRATYVTPRLAVPALILAAGRWVAADAPSLRLLTPAEAAILRHGLGDSAG
jgi:hypothetical protein